MHKIILVSFFTMVAQAVSAQQLAFSDPATAYLKILIEKNGTSGYQQIGTFRVIGTSYLFGPKLNGHVYTASEKAENTLLSYNTYNQQLEVYQNNEQSPLIKAVHEVDSFKLIASPGSAVPQDLVFYSSRIIDSSKKFFLQQVSTGKRFNLYKAYKSTMGYVSTNYIQSELRQFDLVYDYYYTDATNRRLNKLKIAANNLNKEFKPVKDISAFTSSREFYSNPESVLKQIFTSLNN